MITEGEQRPLTRREKIRLGKQQRAEARAKMTPEERAADDKKRAAKRAYGRAHRKVDTNSRPYRWAAAIGQARAAADKVAEVIEDFNGAMDELRGLQEEYQEWFDNLPEGLQQSATGEKLQEIINLDLEDADEPDLGSKVDDVEGIELPQGFGRD